MTPREAILRIVKPLIKVPVRIGSATNIDTDNNVCDIDLGNGSFLYAVQLQAVTGLDETGVIVIPSDGSVVIAAMVEGVEGQWSIINCSSIESFQVFTASGSNIQVNNNGQVWLNGNSLGPLVDINKLITRLNDIEKIVSNHQHLSAQPGDATASNGSQIATETVVDDISNEYVQQGNGT